MTRLIAPDGAPAQAGDASFVFYPKEWLWHVMSRGLSLREQGQLITQILQAVADGDRDAVKQWQGSVIGRVFWHEKQERPKIPMAIQRAVLARDGGRCRRCGSSERPEIDHIVAYSKGGGMDLDNLQVLCKPCNRRKGAN